MFPNFESLPCFNIDVQPELVNNNFNDENNCQFHVEEMQMKTVSIKKTKSDQSVWSRWQPSTGKNDFN